MNIDQYIYIKLGITSYLKRNMFDTFYHVTKKRHINDPSLLVIKIMRTNYLGQNIAPTILYRKA